MSVIKFLDLSRESSLPDFKMKVMSRFDNILNQGCFLFGENLIELENKLADYLQVEDAVVVKSGTDSIILSLMALNISNGSKVALPAFSAIPTASAVIAVGATPVYVDIEGPNIDPKELEKIINEVDAVIPVHLFGNSCNISEIIKIANQFGVPVIEDCAQSFGSTINKQHLGTFGVCGSFSFYPSKNLGVFGDGGAVVTNDLSLAGKIRELRFYGQKNSKEMGSQSGINSRMDEFQCAVALEKLDKLDFIEKRLKLKDYYIKHLKFDTGVHWNDGDVPHLMPILVKNRKKFISDMLDKGIQTVVHYPFTLPAAVSKNRKKYPIAEYWSKHVVSIPFNPWLTDNEVERIITTVNEVL